MPNIILGSTDALDIPSQIGPSGATPAGQIYIGNDIASATDNILIDSPGIFPPGLCFRRAAGSLDEPTVVTSGMQLGYLDFRGYSGEVFWNMASIDAVVDSATAFDPGDPPPTFLRFSTAFDDAGGAEAMRITPQGAVYIGASVGSTFYGPSFGIPKLYVNTLENDWGFVIIAQPTSGAGYGARFHTNGTTAADFPLITSSGAGSGSVGFAVTGDKRVGIGTIAPAQALDVVGSANVTGDFLVDGTRVVTSRQPALPADATDLPTAISLVNAIKAAMIAHGLVEP